MEVNLRCEGLRRALARDDKQVITIEQLNILLKHIGQKLRHAIINGCENDLPPKLDGLPSVEIRRHLRGWSDSVILELRECLTDCPAQVGWPDTITKDV